MNTQLSNRRLALGLTQAELAEQVCAHVEVAIGVRPAVDAQAISRIECGEITWPRRATRDALVAILGCTSESDLGLYPKRTQKDAERADTTKRRNFLALAGLTAVGGVSASRGIGGSEIAEMRARFGRLVELDNHLGGGDTYQLYFAELSRTEAALQTMSPRTAVARGLAELASQQAQQAGWAAFDAGFSDAAHRLFVYGKQAAAEAGNQALEANALVHMAYATNDREAADAADAACDALGTNASPKAAALLESRRAWSRARSGDRDGAARALDLARDALEADTGSDPEPSWYSWIDHNELDIMTGRVWSVLREPGKATTPLVRALDGYPVHWARDRALYLSWLADAYLDAGDPETAIATADEALDLATRVASVRPLNRIREVAQRCVGMGVTAGSELLTRATTARAPIPAKL